MANIAYDDNTLRYAGDFRVSEIALFNAYGNVAGIGSAVIELSIFEDLNSNFLTGSLTFVDTEDLLTKLPIIGQEFLEFKIRTPLKSAYAEGEYDFTNTRMAVYKVGRQRLNQNTQTVTLDFISTEGIRDQNIKISRAFNGPYDQAVAKIFKKSWGLNSKKKLYVQPTLNNFKFVAPNMRPSDLMNMMASRAVPKTSVMPAYLFYENGQGFHFRSMDSFFFLVKSEGLSPHPEMFEYFCDSENTRGLSNPQDNPMSQLRNVMSHTLIGTNDLIKNQRMGTFASKLITHDAYNKTYNTYKYNYIDEYSSLPHLEKDDAATDQALYRGLIAKAHYDFNDLETSDRTRGSAYKYLSDYADARLMVQSNTAKIHNTNSDHGFRVNEYLQRRKSALNLFNNIEIELEVNGNTHLNIGHVIRINVPRVSRTKDDTKSSQNDKYLTGRWLITAIRHSFDFATHNHNMILTCSKETYGSNLQEKISPLVLDVTDEGNPINLYDQTEYN
jgi:hypothetical protein